MAVPLISIIIPTYNRAHIIGETLESIINQTYKKWECLVIDDNSRDHTEELIEFYAAVDQRIKFYKRPLELKKGANTCRNYGLELSSGKFIQWFDSDDIMLPVKLEVQMQSLINENADLCICKYSFYDINMKWLEDRPNIIRNLLKDLVTERAYFNLQTTLFRKDFINIRFDETLLKAQELEFFLRLLENRNFKFKVIEQALVKIRKHEVSITGSFDKGDKESFKSELKVRLKAIQLILKNGDREDTCLLLQRYSNLLIRVLYLDHIGIYFSYIFNLWRILPITYYIWIFKLLLMGVIYMAAGRIPYRLRNLKKI